jgi:GDPmannose 4,6-dehydratase
LKKQKIAIVTGISGQDGPFLCKLLLKKGYKVIGTNRRASNSNDWKLQYLEIDNHPNLKREYLELTEYESICKLIKKYEPDEFYNLAAQSFVAISFEQPFHTTYVDAIGVLNILEAIKNYSPQTKLFQASTSEMFGEVKRHIQNEETPFNPISPYAVAKLYAHEMVKTYRKAYGLFACSGITFNHSSIFRGEEFITQKIVKGIVERILGITTTPLEIGNMSAVRDWSSAEDMVDAFYLMLQAKCPNDYVIGSEETYSIRRLIEIVAKILDLEIIFKGMGLDEKIFWKENLLIKINPEYFRPAEVNWLFADSTKIREELGWKPKISFEQLIKKMVDFQLEKLARKL